MAGLYENIHAKRKRIAAGSKEKMRKPGSKGAPTAKAFKQAAKNNQKEEEVMPKVGGVKYPYTKEGKAAAKKAAKKKKKPMKKGY